MKVTVVPAQVTTVEDRIIGSLGFSQLLLLIIPVFIGGGVFALLPPIMEASSYKYITIGIMALICCCLAIRVKGKVVAFWLVTILRYNLRPKFYIFNKNTLAYREHYSLRRSETQGDDTRIKSRHHAVTPKLDFRDAMKVYATIDNPATNIRFEATKKGGLNVRLTEIEE